MSWTVTRRTWAAVALALAGCATPAATVPRPRAATAQPAATPPVAVAPQQPRTPAEQSAEEALRAWEDRWSPEARARAVSAWERQASLLQGAPEPHLRLAEAHHYGGQATLARGGTVAEASESFARCIEHAAQAVEHGGGDEAEYWRARCDTRRAALLDFAEMVLVQAEVLPLMTRLAEAGGTFDHGGPDRFLAAYFARPTSFEQRDLKRARAHLERARQADPHHPQTAVVLAGHLSVAAQDRATFETEVRSLLQSPPNDPERRGDFELARAQAEALLRVAPDLFE